MSKRIFAAIRVPEHIKEDVRLWRLAHGGISGHFIEPDDLHITLVPPWEEEDIKKVLLKLSSVGPLPSGTEIEFESIFSLPAEKGGVRLLWAEVKESPELSEFRNRVLRALSFHESDRFRPHMTIVRFPEGAEFGGISESIHWKFAPKHMVLLESELLSSGHVYRVLGEFDI